MSRSLLLAVLALPYAAPALCAITASAVSVESMPADCAWSRSTQGDQDQTRISTNSSGHCRFDQCGAVVVGPITLPETGPALSAAMVLQFLPSTTVVADNAAAPPTPPPQA